MMPEYLICPCGCGYRGPEDSFHRERLVSATPEQIDRAQNAADEAGFKRHPGGYYTESDTAVLIGLTDSALRKQVQEKRNKIPFIGRGNRRFYSIEQIANFF